MVMQKEQSTKDSTGLGSDFPGSAGDRERGKFRPSATPRLTVVAVTDDDGRPVAAGLVAVLNELLLYQRAMLLALSIETGERVDDLLRDAQ